MVKRQRYYIKSQLAVFLLLTLIACVQSGKKSLWTSSHRSLSFNILAPWNQLPTLDTEKETLTGVIDLSDGKSYIIKMGRDVSKEVLPDDSYHESIKKTMLAPNSANRLLFEGDTTFHGRQAHRMDFLMNTEKWGLMKQVNLTRRDGKQFLSVQMLYPIKADEIDKSIPDVTIQFDRSVLINNK